MTTLSISSLEERKERALELLARFGQAHVLEAWDRLSESQRAALLEQVESVPWPTIKDLYDTLVARKQTPVTPPPGDWEPAQPIAGERESAVATGEQMLRQGPEPRYALLVVAGGTGSGLKFDHAKGLFPATPLSKTPLYQAIVDKSKAAARAYGHARMYPIVVMVSPETEAETRDYFEKNDYFGERDRVRITRQQVLPFMDRRPGHEGRVVMKSDGAIAVGGAGHGDAFDYTLTSDTATVEWLSDLGVRYVHFLNVDNLLNPVGDAAFLGEHVLSETPAVSGRAHISVILIPKPSSGRMGNIISHHRDGRLLQESIDYGLIPDVDRRCRIGHASLQVVTLSSLPDTTPIPYMAAAKEVRTESDGWVPVWKFERSSNNKARYGALLFREAHEVFASIKKRSEDAAVETPATAAKLQSDYWKTKLRQAGEAAGRAYVIPDSSVLELPWDADFLDPVDLANALAAIRFPTLLRPDVGYLVLPGWRGFREMSMRPEPATLPPTTQRLGRKARRWDDQSPDEHRLRALIAAFNNHFERDPDVITRAPGRNTLLGDHQDYPPLPQDGSAASYTIAWASQKNVLIAARRRPDRAIKLLSVNHQQSFTFSLDDLEGLSREAARGALTEVYGQELYPWARNALAFLFSARHGHGGVRTSLPVDGAEFAIEGNIPMGAGQSSSAAFLVAMALAANTLYSWGIPRSDLFTLADLARAGEHEDYSPFIPKGRCGYLDQIATLAAEPGRAVVINHGNYRQVESLDLTPLASAGYVTAIALSGLSRSLAETDYGSRVDELSRLPPILLRLLHRKGYRGPEKHHVHQFTFEEWQSVSNDLEREDPTLARRARYLFEENRRMHHLLAALRDRRIERVIELVNESGAAMSMDGPYQISGWNRVPLNAQPIAALDLLRSIVLKHAGEPAAARMIGGGGAGPLCVLMKQDAFANPRAAKAIVSEWQARTGLEARLDVDPPAAGAGVLWERPVPDVVRTDGDRRIETYVDALGDTVYRLVDDGRGVSVEVVPERGTIRSMLARIDGATKAILYNPEKNPAENGAGPYLGPWINRIKDGRAVFRGERVHLMRVKGVRNDGYGHALHGLMTLGWHVDLDATTIGADGIRLVSWIDPADYTDDAGVQRFFGPSRTVLTHRLDGDTLHVESTISHLGKPGAARVPVMAAVHPWFLLDRKKHEFAEVQIPARRHRITWKKAMPRLQMIPLPYVPALPIMPGSRHNFRTPRRLGIEGYDDSYTRLESTPPFRFPVVRLRDWFRDVQIEVGLARGYDEFTMYRPETGEPVVCLEPQISSINALGKNAPLDADVPTVGPGEHFETHMFIRVSSLAQKGAESPFTAKPDLWARKSTGPFPRLLSHGIERPLAHPLRTMTHKDAIRVFFAGRWHIYGTGHEMRDLSNPPPGYRPVRHSILFHLVSDNETGPYHEENPPILLGEIPRGIYEAPTLVTDGNVLHLFAQTTYYRLGGTIEHFVSSDGHTFTWKNTAIQPVARTQQAGIYDVDACVLSWTPGSPKALVYSGFSRDGGRDDRPDPCVFISMSKDGTWNGLFPNSDRPILTDKDVWWHNAHDRANPYYEWGLEGAQILPVAGERYLLLCVGFERRAGRAYMAAQRLFFALYDREFKLLDVSEPILPIVPGWEEYGHGSMMVDVNDPTKLRVLFQARPANLDRRFRDTDTWRLFEAVFDLTPFQTNV